MPPPLDRFRHPAAAGIRGDVHAETNPPSSTSGEQTAMIEMNNDADLRQVFSRFLLIATVFTPRRLENEKQSLAHILERCGFTVTRSDCMILETTRIEGSLITIARYSLEYRDSEDTGGRTLCLEGDLAMQTDHRGSVNISISAKPGISMLGFEAVQSRDSLFSDEPGPSPLPS